MMPNVLFSNLVIVAAIAFGTPLLLGFAPRLRLPATVLEILAGIVLGPSVLGWVAVDTPIQILALIGVTLNRARSVGASVPQDSRSGVQRLLPCQRFGWHNTWPMLPGSAPSSRCCTRASSAYMNIVSHRE
jgi:hypothetical protein